MNQKDNALGLGHFLEHHHWLQALELLEYQLDRKKTNRHFWTLEMFYYEKLRESFDRLRTKKYFNSKVANSLFYGLSREFAVVPHTIPKSNLGLRRYKFMACPIRILYYAIGVYLLKLTEEYLKDYDKHAHICSHYGGKLEFFREKFKLEPESVFYLSHYKDFCEEVKKENENDTDRKIVIRLDIQNYFEELSIPKLLKLLEERVKPSIRKEMCYDEATQAHLVSFFDFMVAGASGIPQSENNIISSFIGYLFLVFGDLYLDDEVRKYGDSVESHRIVRYMDDIYISITFKEENGDLRAMFNSLAIRISDCLYEKLGLRLNPKTTIYRLKYEDDRNALEGSLKKVSQGMEIPVEENGDPPEEKINGIFAQLKKLKGFPIGPHFQGHFKSNRAEEEFNEEQFEDLLKGVYDDEVMTLMKDPDCPFYRSRLRRILLGSGGFDFELVNAYPKPIIILILVCTDVAQKFEGFLLSKSEFTSRDVSLALTYLCQNQFAPNQLLDLLRDSPQIKEIMEIFTQEGLYSESLGYYELTEEQTLNIRQPNVIEQIRLRVLAEQKEDFSVALNHLLNEIHAICGAFDEKSKRVRRYDAPKVSAFLKRRNVPHETYTQVRNLFDRRNKTLVSHADPIAWTVTKEEYEGYRSHVGKCLKHLLS